MIKVVDECVGCEGRCLGSACPNKNVTIVVCDVCKEEYYPGYEEVFDIDGEHICLDCVRKKYKIEL